MSEQEPIVHQPISDKEDIAQFLLRTPLEIAHVFRALIQAKTNVGLYFNAGRDMMISRVLQVDVKEKVFIIDIGSHDPTNQALLGTTKVLFVTDLDGVKIQFSTDTPRRVNFEGKPALQLHFPADMIKLQRREYFRLTTPITSPYTVSLNRAGNALTLELHDISLGGMGIWLKDDQVGLFETGQILQQASIDLGPTGRFPADLLVRNLHPVQLRQGAPRWMLGVSFMELSRGQESALQRLMVQLEREKKALLG
ncbi:flagellar brake protein [Chitinibacter tainanensis]|uniref:flagellar brake protein n=1 Tax=Chitinibacter tainanensis TaxID=230667 RepID=UPI0004083388|nr:flagellar brake protein [Chitinibacter tainanensis]